MDTLFGLFSPPPVFNGMFGPQTPGCSLCGAASNRAQGAYGLPADPAMAGMTPMFGGEQLMTQLLTLLLGLMSASQSGFAPPDSSAGTFNSGGSAAGGSSGGTSGGSAGFNTPGGVVADPSQFQGGTENSRRLAAAALKESTDGDSQGGWCARDVGEALRAVGLGVARGDAWTKAEVLAKDSRFREIKVAPSEIDRLPPGAIIVWDKGPGLPYGHISIALGDGREASDLLKKQMHLKTSFRVFMPL